MFKCSYWNIWKVLIERYKFNMRHLREVKYKKTVSDFQLQKHKLTDKKVGQKCIWKRLWTHFSGENCFIPYVLLIFSQHGNIFSTIICIMVLGWKVMRRVLVAADTLCRDPIHVVARHFFLNLSLVGTDFTENVEMLNLWFWFLVLHFKINYCLQTYIQSTIW